MSKICKNCKKYIPRESLGGFIGLCDKSGKVKGFDETCPWYANKHQKRAAVRVKERTTYAENYQ